MKPSRDFMGIGKGSQTVLDGANEGIFVNNLVS